MDSFDVAFRDTNHVGTHSFILITGLNPFTLSHCGPSPPCVRFASAVTDCDATLGTRYLARASGAGTCLRLTKPSLARRTSNGENMEHVRYFRLSHIHGYVTWALANTDDL